MAPESIIESTGMQDILGTDDYQEPNTSTTTRSNSSYNDYELGSQQEGSTSYILRIGNTKALSGRESAVVLSQESRSNSGKITNKTRKSKIGGNKGQLLIDPWLSADNSKQFERDSPSHKTIGGINRLSASRSRFDNEPLALMSTSATSSGKMRDETPGPTFASPRKHAGQVVEISCSDQEEKEIDESQVQREAGIARQKPSNHKKTLAASPSSDQRRLVRSNSSLISINVISSSDEEDDKPTTSLRNRRTARDILDSSSSESETYSAGPGIDHTRNAQTVADNTIPQFPNTPPMCSAAVAPGSDTKMPWSIVDGPDRDIVLSTPTSKQKVRHYNVILDSEDELSDGDGTFDIWKSGRNTSHLQYQNLFGTSEAKKKPSQAIISDSEVETVASDAPLTQRNYLSSISQSQVEEPNEKSEKVFSVESQDFFEISKSRQLPDKELKNIKVVTNLRKPRPLVLKPLSEGDTDSNGDGENGSEFGVEEQHLKLRINLFGDAFKGNSRLSEANQIERNKQGLSGGQRGAGSLLVSPSLESTQTKLRLTEQDQSKRYYPLWKKINNVESQVKERSTAIEDEEEDEDEPLVDPRVRRRSQKIHLASPQKRMKLTDIAPDVAAMELALKADETHTRQLIGGDRPRFSRMETIESFSTISDSQTTPQLIGHHSTRTLSQREEIEGFSDDHRSQFPQNQQYERRTRRYSGLQFSDQTRSTAMSKNLKDDGVAFHSQTMEDIGISQEFIPISPDLNEEISSPILHQSEMERCPICQKLIPSDELMSHVDAELSANEQQERDDMEKQDKAMALALDKIYQTQDVTSEDPVSRRRRFSQDSSPRRPHSVFSSMESSVAEDWKSNPISKDTPTRKVDKLTLDISPRTSDDEGNFFSHDSSHLPLYKIPSSSTILSGGLTDSEQEVGHDSIVLSDLESVSSQSAFQIQPGQTIQESSLSISDVFPARLKASPSVAQKSYNEKRRRKLKAGSIGSPLVIDDMPVDVFDDDLDDFLDKPEPASMVNQSFRGSKSANRAKTTIKEPSKMSKVLKKKQKMVELDDSEDEESYSIKENGAPSSSLIPLSSTKRGKPRTNVLDSLLSPSARQKRQSLLQYRNKRKGPAVDIEDEIEMGRLQAPVAEKLWNQEDDPFDAESLDRRQVKGIGLGGVIGGVGAIPGSLSISKVTKNSAAASTARKDFTASQQNSGLNDNRLMTQPSFELEPEGAGYRLHGQEWWSSPQQDNHEYPRENTDPQDDLAERYSQVVLEDTENDLLQREDRTATLDDFVDLRKRRDDPALAMYFAQFNSDPANSSKESGRGRSRGRGQSRNTKGKSTAPSKRGVSFGPGVGPMSTDMGPRNTQTAHTVYESLEPGGSTHDDDGDRYGARKVSFGHATTDNGSMAIRSKPTLPSVPARGSGAKGAKTRPFRRNKWQSRRGRGRGRGS